MREQVRIRYVGADIVEVRGVGVFQRDTVASVPRDLALDLARSEDWEIVAEGPPALEVRLRMGLWDGPEAPPEVARALEPACPADFGDLPSEGPEEAGDPDEADDAGAP